MFCDAALGFINHILANECWARIQLKPFSGQTVRLELGKVCISAAITAEGYFKPDCTESNRTVTLSLPAYSFLRSLGSHSALRSDAQISGSAQLAECLLTVFSKLRWDFESDLSEVIGDIAAHRLALGSKRIIHGQLKNAQNRSRNLAEYLSEENLLLARQHEFSNFCQKTNAARNDLEALEGRIARLEG